MLTSVEIRDDKVLAANGASHSRSADLPKDFGTAADDGRAAALRKALSECHVAAGRYALVLPRRRAILREFQVPPGEADEVHRMILFQLERDLPVPLEDVHYSYVTTKGDEESVRVVAGAIPKKILDPLLADLDRAGCRPGHVYISCFGLASLAPAGMGSSAVVGLMDGYAEIVIAEKGVHVLSSSATLPERTGERLATEIERTLRSYMADRPDASVDQVLLAAGGEQAESLAKDVSEALGRPVETLGRADFGLEAAAAAVSIAADRDPRALPDMLHPPVVRRKIRLSRGTKLTILITLLAGALLAAGQVLLDQRLDELHGIEEELAEPKRRADAIRARINNMRFVQPWSDERYSWVDLLQELSKTIDHSTLLLQNVVFDNGTVTLSGTAKSKDPVSKLVADLRDSKTFRTVVLKSGPRKQSKGKYSWSFTISGRLSGSEWKDVERKKKRRRNR